MSDFIQTKSFFFFLRLCCLSFSENKRHYGMCTVSLIHLDFPWLLSKLLCQEQLISSVKHQNVCWPERTFGIINKINSRQKQSTLTNKAKIERSIEQNHQKAKLIYFQCNATKMFETKKEDCLDFHSRLYTIWPWNIICSNQLNLDVGLIKLI